MKVFEDDVAAGVEVDAVCGQVKVKEEKRVGGGWGEQEERKKEGKDHLSAALPSLISYVFGRVSRTLVLAAEERRL
eukprot:765003-Hanusia_phi.AAC.2